jgi:hypothetical protein
MLTWWWEAVCSYGAINKKRDTDAMWLQKINTKMCPSVFCVCCVFFSQFLFTSKLPRLRPSWIKWKPAHAQKRRTSIRTHHHDSLTALRTHQPPWRLLELVEAKVVGVLTEALTADVELVLADQRFLVGAHDAAASTLAQTDLLAGAPLLEVTHVDLVVGSFFFKKKMRQ